MLLNSVFASEYLFTLENNNYQGAVVVEVTYGEDGFNKHGWNIEHINKETGKLYDSEGFDESGYDIRGFNELRIHKVTKAIYDEEGYDFQEFNSANQGRDVCFSGDANHYYSYGYYRVSSIGAHGSHNIKVNNSFGYFSGRKFTVTHSFNDMIGNTSGYHLTVPDPEGLYSFRKYGSQWYSRPDNGSSYEYKTGVCKKRVKR